MTNPSDLSQEELLAQLDATVKEIESRVSAGDMEVYEYSAHHYNIDGFLVIGNQYYVSSS